MGRTSLATAAIMLAAVAVYAQDADTVLPVFRAQVKLEQSLLAGHLGELERIQGELRTESDRLVRLLDDLLRAEREGEDVEGFTARSTDIRKTEASVEQLIAATQQVRAMIAIRRSTINGLEQEIGRLQSQEGQQGDRLSGRWDATVEPGGSTGTFTLRLNGTLVTGVYELSGGWKGSFRGTYVGETLRLERIDAELGFVAVYTGRLVSDTKLAGSWQATNLAAGLPASGTWVADKQQAR